MHRTKIKFDALADANGTRAKYHHFFLCFYRIRLALTSKAAVIIGGCRLKFRRAGIHHLKGGGNAIGNTQVMHFPLCHSGIASDDLIRKFNPFCLRKKFRRQRLPLKTLLHLY